MDKEQAEGAATWEGQPLEGAGSADQVLTLKLISKSDVDLQSWMKDHYSQPKGFVGRQLIYKIFYNETCYGAIAGGSATRFLPGRPDIALNNIVNNIFFHCFKVNNKYPIYNFTSKVVILWQERVKIDWFIKYKDEVMGFETLVELPRSGELYKKAGWVEIGQTKGYTCKRVAGKGTDSWSGKRVWNTKDLRPKRVLFMEIKEY